MESVLPAVTVHVVHPYGGGSVTKPDRCHPHLLHPAPGAMDGRDGPGEPKHLAGDLRLATVPLVVTDSAPDTQVVNLGTWFTPECYCMITSTLPSVSSLPLVRRMEPSLRAALPPSLSPHSMAAMFSSSLSSRGTSTTSLVEVPSESSL